MTLQNDSFLKRGKAAENIWAHSQEAADLKQLKSKLDSKQQDKLQEKASA